LSHPFLFRPPRTTLVGESLRAPSLCLIAVARIGSGWCISSAFWRLYFTTRCFERDLLPTSLRFHPKPQRSDPTKRVSPAPGLRNPGCLRLKRMSDSCGPPRTSPSRRRATSSFFKERPHRRFSNPSCLRRFGPQKRRVTGATTTFSDMRSRSLEHPPRNQRPVQFWESPCSPPLTKLPDPVRCCLAPWIASTSGPRP